MSSIWQARRSATDAKVAGVCGGLAAHWSVDPVLVRVGWVLLALTGGIGVVLYVAGWLLVPLEGRPGSVADGQGAGRARRISKEIWVVLVALACVVVFTVFSSVSPFGLGSALVVAVVWYFGLYRSRARRAGPPPAAEPPAVAPAPPILFSYPGPPTPFTEAAQAWQARVHQVRTQPYASHPPAPAPAPDERAAFWADPDPVGLYADPVPVTPPVRPGSTVAARRLRLVTLVALGLTLGGLGAADLAGTHVAPTVYAAAALLVLGLALVAATWFGRARGLLPLGMLLALTTVVAATGLSTAVAAPLRHPDGYGTRRLDYAGTAALPRTPDTLEAGQLVVDLRDLRAAGPATYRAHVDDGQLLVRVPAGTGVRLHYTVGLGQAEALHTQLGFGRHLDGTVDVVPAAGRPTLDLELSVDQGQIEVDR